MPGQAAREHRLAAARGARSSASSGRPPRRPRARAGPRPGPRTSARSGPGRRRCAAQERAPASSRTSDGSRAAPRAGRPPRAGSPARGPRRPARARPRRRCRAAPPAAASPARAACSAMASAPGHRAQRSVERELPDRARRPRAPPAPSGPRRPGSRGRAAGRTAARPCGGRPGARLATIRRAGHREGLVGEPGAHALARLLHRRVGEPDHREGRKARPQVHLDLARWRSRGRGRRG